MRWNLRRRCPPRGVCTFMWVGVSVGVGVRVAKQSQVLHRTTHSVLAMRPEGCQPATIRTPPLPPTTHPSPATAAAYLSRLPDLAGSRAHAPSWQQLARRCRYMRICFIGSCSHQGCGVGSLSTRRGPVSLLVASLTKWRLRSDGRRNHGRLQNGRSRRCH